MTAESPLIDFPTLRGRISIREVLRLIDYTPTRRTATGLRGPCPLCHSGATRIFAIYLDSNRYYCFQCRSSGNAIELWAAVTQATFYRAALDLCQQLSIEIPYLPSPYPPRVGTRRPSEDDTSVTIGNH